MDFARTSLGEMKRVGLGSLQVEAFRGLAPIGRFKTIRLGLKRFGYWASYLSTLTSMAAPKRAAM